MMIKNDIQLLKEKNFIDIDNVVSCEICREKNHRSVACSRVHNIPNIKKIIYDYNHLGTQLRVKSNRDEYYNNKFNALREIKDVQESVFDIFECESDLAEEAI